MKKILFLIIVWAYLLFQSVYASVYYVDPSSGGSNSNSGLSGSPWATLQYAALTAQAGDTVYVQASTYAEKVTFANSGTADAFITFIGIGSVIVQEPTNTTVWSGTLNLNTKSYIRIQNFSIQNAYWFGIYVEACDHIYLDHNSTYNTGASGISVWHSSYVYAAYNTIQKACYQSLSMGSQECITFAGVSNFEIHDNEVFDSGGSNNGGEGIDTKENCTNGKVHNNVVHDLIRLGIYADSWDKLLQYIDIYNNRVYNCSDGIVVSSENGGTASDINIYNNITYSNGGFGIIVSNYVKNGPRKNIAIMNNTVYNNGFGDGDSNWGGGIINYTDSVSTLSIFNNIVASNDAMQISNSSSVASVMVNKNLINGYKGLNWTGEVKGTNVIEANPLFVDVDGADNIIGTMDDDLDVTDASPAINAGTNTGAPAFDFNHYARPAEGTTDIGAFEHNSVYLGIKNPAPVVESAALVQIYPNPSTDYFNLKVTRKVDRIDVTDIAGVTVQSYTTPAETLLKLTISNAGLYMIRVYAGDVCQVYKVIKY